MKCFDLDLGVPAVDYLAMQSPITDPEDHPDFHWAIIRAVRDAVRRGDGRLQLPALGFDHSDLVSLVEDAAFTARRHANDRDTFNDEERSHARRAARALERFTA